MSHYVVAVFSDDGDVDKLLAPYNESDKKYFVFHPVEYGDILKKFKDFKKKNKKWKLEEYIQNFNYIEVDGQWGYMSNPNGYWDYYSLDGGDYMFNLKEDVELPDGAWDYRKNDYVWKSYDKDAAADAEEFWDDFIGETALAEPPGMWNKQYFLQRYKTKKRYVKEMSRTIPYAFITPDGVWHSAGKVGWFGMSDETAEDSDRYMKEWDEWIAGDANPYVNLVDCHI